MNITKSNDAPPTASQNTMVAFEPIVLISLYCIAIMTNDGIITNTVMMCQIKLFAQMMAVALAALIFLVLSQNILNGSLAKAGGVIANMKQIAKYNKTYSFKGMPGFNLRI
jgi:hypothetical protein